MIYIKLEKEPKNIGELLKSLFSCNTGLQAKNVTTYKDKEYTIIQCSSNKNRSYDDIAEIINTYFPGTKPKTIIHELITADIRTSSGIELFFYMMICGDINKHVCLYLADLSSNFDVFNQVGKSISTYSWDALLGMLGIQNQNELRAYIKKNKPNTSIIVPEDLIITDFKTLYKELGIYEPDEKLFSYILEKERKKALILYKISLLKSYFNKDWKPNWTNSNEKKWYPYFNKNTNGWVFDGSFCYYYCFGGQVGLYKTQEISNHIGTYFKDIYIELAEC